MANLEEQEAWERLPVEMKAIGKTIDWLQAQSERTKQIEGEDAVILDGMYTLFRLALEEVYHQRAMELKDNFYYEYAEAYRDRARSEINKAMIRAYKSANGQQPIKAKIRREIGGENQV